MPLLWDVQDTLIYNPENGSLKSSGAFDQNATLQMLSNAFHTWADLPGTQLQVQQGPFLMEDGVPIDVDETNYLQFLGTGTEECYPDFFDVSGDHCVSPIIFDENGGIIDDLFGTCARFSILGFAGYDDVEDASGDSARRIVRRGQALFSGACLDPAESQGGCAPCQRVLTDTEIRTIVTHEVGHLMGMDHSQVNPQAFTDCLQNPGGCPAEISQALPTMFPILVNGAHMLDLHRDDEAYFIHLYGNDLSQGCTVNGTIFANDGSTPVRGVEVVAKNVNDDLTDRVSFISGAEAPRRNNFSKSQGNCASNCGDYRITHLRDGATYQLCVQRISSQFTGGSSIEPVDPPFQAFTNECPSGLTVTCECTTSQCPEFNGIDIVTDTDPSDVDLGDEEPGNISGADTGGGCSFIPPVRPTGYWNTLLKSLR